jgi:hypothetical protein
MLGPARDAQSALHRLLSRLEPSTGELHPRSMLMGLTERLQVFELLSRRDHLGDHVLYLFRRISEIIDGREDLTAEIAPIEF